MTRKILMLVPYHARDLEGAALVGHHLRHRLGYEVVYTNGYGIQRKLLSIAPDALVLDHLEWDFKADEARLARRLGMKVFVLPSEGLFLDPEAALRSVGHHHGATGILDGVFSWGEFLRRTMVEAGAADARRVPVTGCPRFDLYADPWLRLMEPRQDFLRRMGFADPGAPLVVWATNTPYFARDPERIVRRYVRRASWSKERVLDFLADERTQFAEHGELVAELARQHPEWNILIKVHPAERSHPYRGFVRDFRNVRIAHTEPVRTFLYHCDVLLQRNCTTATEAWMLGKPVLDLEIGAYRRPPPPSFKDGNEVVTTRQEAKRAVECCLAGAGVPSARLAARERFIAEHFHRIDGRAAERCAGHIARALEPPVHDASRTAAAVERMREERRAEEDRRWVNRLKDATRIPRDTSLRFWDRILPREGKWFGSWKTTEPEITDDMVQQVYERYDSLHLEHIA